MAVAIKRKVVETIELTLGLHEAEALTRILGNIEGSPTLSARAYTQNIYIALSGICGSASSLKDRYPLDGYINCLEI